MPGEYLSEPIARKTMAYNPEVSKEFLAKVAADTTFAADRDAYLAARNREQRAIQIGLGVDDRLMAQAL